MLVSYGCNIQSDLHSFIEWWRRTTKTSITTGFISKTTALHVHCVWNPLTPRANGHNNLRAWGPFLESPGLYGPEIKYSNRNINNNSTGPGQQTTPFCFINWQFYRVRCKTIETSVFNVNGDSLPGPLITGTFEKRRPVHMDMGDPR